MLILPIIAAFSLLALIIYFLLDWCCFNWACAVVLRRWGFIQFCSLRGSIAEVVDTIIGFIVFAGALR